jgi:hypothetical protein
MKPVRTTVLAALVCIACGDRASQTNTGATSPTGNSTIDTTLPSLPAHATSTAYAAKGLNGIGAGNQITVSILEVANVGDVCSWPQAPTSQNFTANVFDLLLLLGKGNDPNPVTTGTYTLGSNLTAGYFSWDANCQMAPNSKVVLANAGMVDVQSVSPSYKGAFDLTFASGHFVGSFDAPLCAASDANFAAVDAGATCASYPRCGAPDAGSGPCLPRP